MSRPASARRDEEKHRQYDVTEEQSAFATASARPGHSPDMYGGGGWRCQPGCAGRMQLDFHHGLTGPGQEYVRIWGVETLGWQGARREHTGRIRPTRNAARREGSAAKNVKLFWTGRLGEHA